jgi:hypothetical protein
MILLRVLSILAGCLVLIVPPLLMVNEADGPRFFEAATVYMGMAGLVLVAASFVFVGFASTKIKRSPRLRALAALALAVPFAASAAMLWLGGEAEELLASAVMSSFTAMLFVAFVYPARKSRKRRWMRRRASMAG